MCSCQLRFNLHHVVNVEGKSTENRALYTFLRPLRSQKQMSFHAFQRLFYNSNKTSSFLLGFKKEVKFLFNDLNGNCPTVDHL